MRFLPQKLPTASKHELLPFQTSLFGEAHHRPLCQLLGLHQSVDSYLECPSHSRRPLCRANAQYETNITKSLNMLKNSQPKQQDEPNHPHKRLPAARRSFLARAGNAVLPRHPADRGDAPGRHREYRGPTTLDCARPHEQPAPGQAAGSRCGERRCHPCHPPGRGLCGPGESGGRGAAPAGSAGAAARR